MQREVCFRLLFPPDDYRGLSNGWDDAPAGSWLMANKRDGDVYGPDVNVVWDLQPAQPKSTSATAASKFDAVTVMSGLVYPSTYAWWVLAAAPDYSWAVITGGAPSVPQPGGCSTMSATYYGANGMMVVSRYREDPGASADVREALSALDWTKMRPVLQAGCVYSQPWAGLDF